MKSLIFLTVFSLSLIAKAGDTNKPLSQTLSEKVKAALIIPESLKHAQTSQKITVYFMVDANGNVTEANADTCNKETRTDIERQFLKLNLKGLTPGVYNCIDVSFVIG